MSHATDPELKTITHEGELLHRVGCRNCGSGDWIIFTNGKNKFVGYCPCGYKIEIGKAELKSEPDQKAIDMRFIT